MTTASARTAAGRHRKHRGQLCPWTVIVERGITHGQIPRQSIQRALTHVGHGEQQRGIVRVIVVDDDRMQQLNRDFLGRDRVTDVLAFPLENTHSVFWEEGLIGEIYCGYDHAIRWRREHGGTIRAELCRLAVHGCLHLFGYDHHSEQDQRRMAAAENRYLAEAGLISSRVLAQIR